MTMSYKLFFAAAVSALFLVSCKKDEITQTPVDVIEDVEYDMTEKIDVPLYFMGTSGSGYIGESIAKRCTNVCASEEEAEVIVVKDTELSANKDVLSKAVDAGKVIIELEPVNALHAAFWESIGLDGCLSANGEENDLILLATHGNSSYQLQNPFLEGTYTSNEMAAEDENASESGSSERNDFTNQLSSSVEVGKTVEFFVTVLNSLAHWVDQQVTQPLLSTSPIPEFDGDLYKYITDASRCQYISKTLNIGVDNYEFSHVACSDADKVSKHSTIDIDIYVAPLYAYEQNGDYKGDYYFVTMSVVSHNKPLYELYKTWHGWVRTWAHIFYGKTMNLDFTLLTAGHGTMDPHLEFFQTPQPTTTSGSTSYNTGFSKSLNISGQGGISGGAPTGTITVGGSFTWSNSQTVTVQDQSIEMSTNPGNRGVHYEFWCNNDQGKDDTWEAVPAIARSDQKSAGSWCWHVTDTKDDDANTHFVLKLDIRPVYAYRWRHSTWGGEGYYATTDDLLSQKDRTYYFDLKVPNRQRNGVFEIKSTNSQYMYGLKIIDPATGKIVAQDTGAYERNFTQRYQVPVGTYNVEYEIRNGDTGESLGNYRISDVEITTAQTTTKSTIDGKKI